MTQCNKLSRPPETEAVATESFDGVIIQISVFISFCL